MRASEVMTRPVVTVHTATSVRQAAATLADAGITAMPVLDDDGRLVGMVSESDLLANRVAHDPRSHLLREDAGPDSGQPDPAHTVGEVMTTPVVAMTAGADVADVADLMLRYEVRSVPIVDGAEVLGIVSRRDLLRTLVRDDAAVAAEISSRLASYGGQPDRWPVHVDDSVVTLGGHFDDETERRVAVALASTVPGVSRVHTRHG